MSRLLAVCAALFSALNLMCTPSRAQSPVPATTIFKWEGFYAGGNLGYGWTNPRLDISPTNSNFLNAGYSFSQAGLLANFPDGLSTSGVNAGFQLGYNVKLSQFVLGIEADANYSDLTGSYGHGPVLVAGGVDNAVDGKLSIRSLFTLRPRIGVAIDNLLIYATGGFAAGHVRLSETMVLNQLPQSNNVSGLGVFDGSELRFLTGWTLGGGAELALSDRTSLKVEYLYVDLGSINSVANFTGFTNNAINGAAMTIRASDLQQNIVRAGINFKLD